VTWISDAAVRRLAAAATWPDFSDTRYTLVRELGRGGMGVVYLARDAELDRDVAVKVMSTAGAHPELAARLRTEARVLARLEHPGVVPVFDVGRLPDGRLYYAMQLVRGETLTAAFARLPDRAERLRLFERACEPIAFAHAQGVVHRDLKPENVMVGGFGAVHVLDWGVAKVPGVAEPADTVLGTRGFMAPEQAAGGGELVDSRSDVYALGAMLFELLADAPPPQPGADVRHLLGRRRVPKRLRAICARALAVDPADRYAGAAELADDLARLRAGRAVTAYPETVLDRLARFAATYRTPILLVLAYLVMRTIVALATRR
jgi:serine/threonine protein kinase